MIEIAVKCRGLDDLHLTYQKPVLFEEIVKAVQPQAPYRIYGVRFCHQLRHMKETADQSGVLEVLDLRDPEGNMIYQSSLTFLYLKAIHDLFGSDADAIVKNSLSKGLFTTIRAKQLGRDTADRIEIRMQELADMALPITRIPETRENLLKKSDFRKDQKKLLETAPDLKELYLYRLGEQEELFYEPLVPDTSYLTLFEVRRYMNGFLLRFPHPSDPDDIPPFEEQKLLYEAFSEETHWNRLTGIEYASDLNTAVKEGKAQDLILLNEALHEKRIAEIASRIKEQGSRLILIAGPSSSGKTSFAKRLQIQLRVLGLKPLYLGTDDYYEERKNIPLKKDGTRDLEGLDALDLNLFNEQMESLLSGKKTDIPVYDFVTGTKKFGTRITSIESSQPIIMEGLHCLNPDLTSGIQNDVKFRIYISPLTQINIDEHNRIPTTDARMLRRIVRDAQFRGESAAETMQRWPSVRAGEDRNIFPFCQEADVFFNSALIYELPVLKHYAEPQLREVTEDQAVYPEAVRMLRFLSFFEELKDDQAIPNNSIMREFIGGSILVH